MRISKKSFIRHSATLTLAGFIAMSAAIPAFADTVQQGITAGNLTASIATVDLHAAIAHSNVASTANLGSMTLTTTDDTGYNKGWSVTVSTSDLVWTTDGTSTGGTNIPAANFTLATPSAPSVVSGQAVNADLTSGPKFVGTGGVFSTSGSAVKVITAAASNGNGTYDQVLGTKLDIPASSAAGTYTSTLTVTASATP